MIKLNGEIDCAAKDVDKVKEVLTNYGLIQEYETSWIKDNNAEFSISDLWGDIEDSLNKSCLGHGFSILFLYLY